MADGNGGLLATSSDDQTVILSGEIALLGMGGGMGRLDQGGAQPWTAFAGATTQALPCTLIVARTHASPRSQMPCTWEAAHIGSDLGKQHLSQPPLDPWDRLQTRELCLKRAQTLSNLLAHMGNRFVQTVNMGELLLDQETMVSREMALQGLREHIPFRAHAPTS